MRLLILAVVAFLIYTLLRQLLRGWAKKELPPRPGRSGTMVRCALCGLHVPEQEALRSGDKYFCSNKHLKEFRQSGPAPRP